MDGQRERQTNQLMDTDGCRWMQMDASAASKRAEIKQPIGLLIKTKIKPIDLEQSKHFSWLDSLTKEDRKKM